MVPSFKISNMSSIHRVIRRLCLVRIFCVYDLNDINQFASGSGLPQRTLLIHGTITILIPYLHTRLRAYALSNAWPDAPTYDRRRSVWGILTSLESSHTFLGLVSFVSFLWDGRCIVIHFFTVDRCTKFHPIGTAR
jgi:hypothetical protein